MVTVGAVLDVDIVKVSFVEIGLMVPSEIVEFFGGDTGGVDIGYQLGFVNHHGPSYQFGLYMSSTASIEVNHPVKRNQLKGLAKIGGYFGLSYGQHGGTIADFSGSATEYDLSLGPFGATMGETDSGVGYGSFGFRAGI
ncbi:hypothetical protein PD716_25390, partial [Vibrio gigantis]|uniref:hypothetical protein n=1 Tax=Vibrio gigantis TaxID=296199 RepID=UPI002FC9FF65